MKCPVCNDANLVMSERQGVEIDYCPQCRGVWLDRGELDKIIERSASPAPQQSQPSGNYSGGRDHDRDRDYDREHSRGHDKDHHGYRHKKSKAGGFLGDLFDF